MQKITAHHLLLLWNSYAPPFERISGMSVWKAGSVFSGETLRSQVFFYYGSWPTKALGPSDVWKTICSLSQSVQASLLVILPRRLWSRNGCGVSRRKRAAASNSCSIFISVCCCLVKVEGDRATITKNITQTPPPPNPIVCPRGCVWLTEDPACLFDADDKRADPWPFSSGWVTGSTLKVGASPHCAAFTATGNI